MEAGWRTLSVKQEAHEEVFIQVRRDLMEVVGVPRFLDRFRKKAKRLF